MARRKRARAKEKKAAEENAKRIKVEELKSSPLFEIPDGCPILTVPIDVLRCIFKGLDLNNSFVHLNRVCKRFHTALDSTFFRSCCYKFDEVYDLNEELSREKLWKYRFRQNASIISDAEDRYFSAVYAGLKDAPKIFVEERLLSVLFRQPNVPLKLLQAAVAKGARMDEAAICAALRSGCSELRWFALRILTAPM
eukprot:TRINITY_DN2654_c0_g1_i1.p1 TRINITY_DN2654_c0_g1~~TRINITY_DN2654_c0_g1_i1.p1  ORF type:complete len:196 (-),score=21.21 TRINITY_DN2654_c0_g1_i1:217-804(-)